MSDTDLNEKLETWIEQANILVGKGDEGKGEVRDWLNKWLDRILSKQTTMVAPGVWENCKKVIAEAREAGLEPKTVMVGVGGVEPQVLTEETVKSVQAMAEELQKRLVLFAKLDARIKTLGLTPVGIKRLQRSDDPEAQVKTAETLAARFPLETDKQTHLEKIAYPGIKQVADRRWPKDDLGESERKFKEALAQLDLTTASGLIDYAVTLIKESLAEAELLTTAKNLIKNTFFHEEEWEDIMIEAAKAADALRDARVKCKKAGNEASTARKQKYQEELKTLNELKDIEFVTPDEVTDFAYGTAAGSIAWLSELEAKLTAPEVVAPKTADELMWEEVKDDIAAKWKFFVANNYGLTYRGPSLAAKFRTPYILQKFTAGAYYIDGRTYYAGPSDSGGFSLKTAIPVSRRKRPNAHSFIYHYQATH